MVVVGSGSPVEVLDVVRSGVVVVVGEVVVGVGSTVVSPGEVEVEVSPVVSAPGLPGPHARASAGIHQSRVARSIVIGVPYVNSCGVGISPTAASSRRRGGGEDLGRRGGGRSGGAALRRSGPRISAGSRASFDTTRTRGGCARGRGEERHRCAGGEVGGACHGPRMPRPLTPEERTIVAEEMALATEVAALRPGADTPYFARLRVRTAGGVRDVLLADRTLAGASATLVDWQTAPLAEVFLGAGVGDEYEHEVEGRTLRGTVLRRHVVGFCGGVVSEICGEGVVLRRVDDGWLADDEWGPRLRRASRGRASGQVRLDAVQRGAVELDATRSLVVLGEAGFGKTTVALHRLAFLARAARAGRRRFRALVVVPTAGLRRLATHLLGELGVSGARVETFERWVAAEAWRVFPALPRRLSADAGAMVARFKRDPALRSVLPRVVAGTPAMREVRRGYRDEPETIRELLLHLFG